LNPLLHRYLLSFQLTKDRKVLLEIQELQALRDRQVLKVIKVSKVLKDPKVHRAYKALQGTLEPLERQVL
jgi:hypothetical protein